MINLFAGILVAACVFAALLWSIYQTIIARGKLQYVQGISAALTLLGMASISYLSLTMAIICGTCLCISAAIAVYLETRWNKVLPFFQCVFGLSLILGLPFTA